MKDSYIDPEATPKAQREREKEAELKSKIRQEVLRMHRGEADEDLERDQLKQREQEAEELSEQRREEHPLWQIVSGKILLRKGVSRYYKNMIIIAAVAFASILAMFTALHQDVRYSRLARQVQLLRERSLNLQTERFQRCSHSAISAELERRGIKLEDQTAPAMVIKR
ncbi:MAG: hypothetical protein SNH88_07520 [Rikenellaceae bacterium]